MGWEASVIAISLAILAVVGLGVGVLSLFWFRDLMRAVTSLENLATTLDREAGPALQNVKRLVDDTSGIASNLRREAEELAGTSRTVRTKVTNAVDAIEDRLVDLDVLVDIAQTELEETVLDVAAALRTGRRSASLLKRLKQGWSRRRR